MRVLYITHFTSRNGSTIALLNIMHEMLNKGVEVGILLPKKEGFLYEESNKCGIDTFSLDYSYRWALIKTEAPRIKNKIKRYLTYCRQVFNTHKDVKHIIEKYRPDIVHCNNGVLDYALLGCHDFGIPHVWHLREYQDLDFGFEVFPSMKFLKWKLRLSYNHNIAITKGIFNHFDLRPSDKVIYDGVIDTKRHESPCTDFDFPYFLYVGTIGQGKGLHCILEQFHIVLQHHPKIHLLIANKYHQADSYFIKCQQVIKCYNIEDCVHFLGARTDVYSLMQSAIALIVPSYFEGFGFITVEAMYNHCLVIGRNNAGTKEQFDNGLEYTGHEIGLRFNDDDELPTLMCKAIIGDFSEMKQHAYNTVVNHYTTQNNADNIYQYYKDILNI